MDNKKCKIYVTWDKLDVEGSKADIMTMLATLLQSLREEKSADDKDIDMIVKQSKKSIKELQKENEAILKEIKKKIMNSIKDIFNEDDEEEEEEIL
jgi:hypothetical protein